MFTHRFASTHHRFMPRGLAIVLAVTLALGIAPLATAARHASTALVHSQSSGTDAVAAGSDGAAQHGIIFVGGRKQGGAHHAMNPRAISAGPPGAPLTRSHSIGGDRSLNSQPDYQGHRPIDSMAKCMPHLHRRSKKHEQPTPHPC